MTVRKINGFAAPYRSKTFRDETNALVNSSGVLYIEQDVYESSGDVVIPPFQFVQEGMVITKDNQTVISKPVALEAPYYITVNSPTTVNTDDLVFQFAKSPYDVASNEVILAEYDGNEWRQQSRVSIDGLIQDLALERVEKGEIGPYSGLTTYVDGSNYRTLSGLLFDNQGIKVKFDNDNLTPVIGSDPNTAWRRVDRIIYRRANDNENRIGVRKLVLGGSYAPVGDKKVFNTSVSTGLEVTSGAKSVVFSDNRAMMLHAEGFGASYRIAFAKYSSDRSTPISNGTIVSNITSNNFSAVVDETDHCHIVYQDNNDIKLVITNSSGTITGGPFTIDSLTNACSNPKIAIDPNNTKLFIVFEYLTGPSLKQLYMATRSLEGSVITPPVRITNTLTSTANPSIDVSDDLLVYLAYEQSGAIKYTILDDIGSTILSPVSISGSTGSSSFGTLIDNASDPIIKITDNKTVFCAFRQRKSISSYGVAIYSNGSAFLPDLITPADNITKMSMAVDSFNNDVHLCVAQSSSLDYVLLKDNAVALTLNIQSSGASNVSVIKDKLGSLIHNWNNTYASTYSNTGAVQSVAHIGPIAVAGVLNSLILGSDEFSLSHSIAVLPKVGMQITVAGSSHSNNGNYVITSVSTQSINALNDTYVIKCASLFTNTESPASGVTVQFANPDGNSAKFIKTVADVDSTRALRTDVLSSDILLARITWPGPVILNYIPKTGAGTNSDLFGMYGDVDVDWSATSSNTFTMSSGTKIIDLLTSSVYTVNGGAFPMSEGDALYVVLDGANFTVTPQVSQINALPWGRPIQVLGFVKSSEFNPHLFSTAGMGQLDVGEEIVLGQDLSKTIRIRLGITSESTYADYTSTAVISGPDPYSTAISKLDSALYSVITDIAEEEDFTVGAGGQSIFTKAVIHDWSSDVAICDIAVYVNGIKQKQDKTGGLTKDFRKNSATSIQFSTTLPENSVVTIRNERTGSPPISGGVDLTNITIHPQPITNAAFSLGTSSKAWKSLYLKDTLTAQIYELKIIGGVLQAVTV